MPLWRERRRVRHAYEFNKELIRGRSNEVSLVSSLKCKVLFKRLKGDAFVFPRFILKPCATRDLLPY